MKLPRILISATASGSGKTLITCGILQALLNRGLKVASFKCGPDYIDPMFHSKIIGAKSKNLDTFFCEPDTIRYLFAKTAKNQDVSVMEGVMGYYDGLGGVSTKASSFELATITQTPVVLIINCKGLSLSVIPMIQGFLKYQKESRIKGVILNQMSKNLYESLKPKIEEELGILVLGYVPLVKDLVIESRHLGLVKPEEIDDFHLKLNRLAEILEETIEIDTLLKLADQAIELTYQVPKIPTVTGKPVIAVARDEAFCFYYQDNLELLEEVGASLVYFSPIHDTALPEPIDGLLLGGGYPELTAETLSKNQSMRESIRDAVERGLPCIAECGGFMYLHREMEDQYGVTYPMCGVIDGEVYKTNRLNRFGYVTITAEQDQLYAQKGEWIAAHEFHYFDSTSCGESFVARKPIGNKIWKCIHGNQSMAAGFPHLYYYSNPKFPYRFLEACMDWRRKVES